MSEAADMAAQGQGRATALASVSVVVPVLNAAALLPPLLDQLSSAGVGEVLLADGGSVDDPAALRGARVVAAPRGRGSQCRAGAEAARGPWLLFLHADTELGAGWAEAAVAAMRDPSRAHVFAFALDDDSPEARRLERAVAWRNRALALPYGDQGLLIHRDLYAAVGGHAPIPIMEDVDLVRRLGRARLGWMPVAARTSARRWRREGWRWRSARNVAILTLWFLGVPPRVLVGLYGRPGR
ncbi:MAG: TIGR04283 family arsenosugar biosynthesis glycosyltransferase [Rubritepida sp.]|nr:TIGR04283 family arsenosugar biosynthesis glycosyltransferase [Rubritepida sp.]